MASANEKPMSASTAPAGGDENALRESLKRCSPETLRAALEFRKTEKITDAKRARRRMAAMVVTACVLALTSAIVNFVILPPGKKAPVEPSVQELRPVIKAKRVETAGPMMITHVDGWNDLDASTRQTQVDRLGKVVAEGGFQMMFVINEYGEVAAAWDNKSGAGLIEIPQ